MPNHPNRSNLSYQSPAPMFADAEHQADIIGYAITASEALAIYATHFAGTGARAVKVIKACPERRGEGPAAGWISELADE